MEDFKLTAERIAAYGHYLKQEERASATLEKYLRDVRAFALWLDGEAVTKEAVTGWKERLLAERRAPSTVNTALSALNGLFRFLGWEGCRARFVKVQRRLFRDPARELTRPDYDRLIATARELGKERLALVMETICATGVRVSELRYLTVEAVQRGGGGDLFERENTHHPDPHQTPPQAAQIRQEKQNRFRRDFSHGKRQKSFTAADMGGNETAVRPGGCGAVQSVPP